MLSLFDRPLGVVLRGLATSALGIVLATPFAWAAPQDFQETPNVSATLIAGQEQAAPGDAVDMALHMRLREGWHTYWINPGDSGIETAITWVLPDGATGAGFDWPTPHRIPVSPLMNYGYKGEVVLPTALTVPANWPEGTPFPVTAEARWLICEEICIPESAVFNLEIPTGPSSVAAVESRALFRDARAQLPRPLPWDAAVSAREGGYALRVVAQGLDRGRIEDAYFYPLAWGALDHAAPQPFAVDADGLTLTLSAGEAPLSGPLDGVLTITETSGGAKLTNAFTLSVMPGAADTATGSDGGAVVASVIPLDPSGGMGLPLVLLFALAGGVILNLMPCVFPVLAMKGLGLMRQGHADRAARLRGGLAYTAGVLVSFGALGVLMVALRAGGAAVGWGFQLQDPVVVALLAYVLFAVGLNLSGVFQIGMGVMGMGAGREGSAGSFLTGILAAVVAAPCTAPFMATALGVSLTQPAPIAGAIFLVLGFGLALPYLLLTAAPGLTRLAPKPGAWMERLKQVLAFPMYASAAWLAWVLAQQVGAGGLLLALLGFVAIAMAAWIWDIASSRETVGGRRLAQVGAAAALLLAAGLAATSDGGAPISAQAGAVRAAHMADQDALAEPFTAARLEGLRAEGRPVFVNMTAAWCITCKVNERMALSGDAFADILTSRGVAYLKGDWTSQDPEITAVLKQFGRAGVPLYVLYPAGDGQPILLPQLLTRGLVEDSFAQL